jgi:hypothetical protein
MKPRDSPAREPVPDTEPRKGLEGCVAAPARTDDGAGAGAIAEPRKARSPRSGDAPEIHIYNYTGILVGCAAFARLLKSEEIVSLPLLVVAVSFSFPSCFYTSLKKRAKVIPQVRSRKTGCTVSLVDAAKFLANRDISRNFAYEDAYGLRCVPEPFVPDTSW